MPGKDLERKIVRGLFTVSLKNLILLTVGLKGEAHGFEILKELEKFTGGLWKPSHSNLYNLLNKMINEGLLESKEEYKGKIRRVKYSLIDRGWEGLRISNGLGLKTLYTVVRHHEILREKLRKEKPRKINNETLLEYLNLLLKIQGILENDIKRLNLNLRR